MGVPVFSIEPSVICCDLCNLESEIRKWEIAGAKALHIDVLDGAFAPSLPVGIDTFQQLAKKTDLPFDVHIMSRNNRWFIEECIKMEPARICFQIEGEADPEQRIKTIRGAGISPGLAFSPETDVKVAEYLLEKVDYVLLMRIKPGYAGFSQKKRLFSKRICGNGKGFTPFSFPDLPGLQKGTRHCSRLSSGCLRQGPPDPSS